MINISPTITNGCTRTSALVYEEDENIDFITVSEDMEAFILLERYFRGAGAAGYPSAEPSVLVDGCRVALRETVHPNNWMFPRPPRIQEVTEEPIPWACPIPPLVHRPYCTPPLLVFHPPGRCSEPLQGDYAPTIFEGSLDSNHNSDGDPTYDPQFMGTPGLFFHETIQDDLARVARIWY